MLFVSILHHYVIWHYTQAFKEILHIWTNFFWFIVNLFSIPQLIRGLFTPWKRIVEDRGEKFNLEDLAGFIIIGIISRLIGVILRTTVILTGTAILLLLCLGMVFIYLFWILAPVLIVFSLFYGIILIFS